MSDEKLAAGEKADKRARPAVGSDPALDDTVAEVEVEDTFIRAVDEGRRRIFRRMVPLLATGFVGGIDVGTGVLALLLVEYTTHSKLLAGLAFSVGFIALALARSELFTEDFLIPVSTVIARQAQFRGLIRLWIGTLVGNLAGGWIFSWLIIAGFPSLRSQAIVSGSYYVDLGLGIRAMVLAIIGGTVITLMTWMQHGTEQTSGKIVAAVTGAFLLGAAGLNHAIVNSLLMFAALNTGHAPFGYLQWAETAGWAAIGNIIGGVGLVTLLRIVQVPHTLKAEREHPAPGVPFHE
ncbi:formate/nitrite transporter family protein [Acidithrix ferrooxidans]|uniref:Inner membrane protein YfdC n=2 Tax=root TaxID=1 RepID=A0A0D8HN15_9ACTN|nr:formate/nitrite transporter family protein [Acidithrix ferrooxidans]KJF18486.1 inner membrane protein YfdC [Acidithrix ferrooxidans]